MKALERKLPPALVFLIFGGAMYLLDRWLPVGEFDFFGRREVIWGLTVLGIVLVTTGVLQFLLKRTTVDPMHPEKVSKLVTRGLYQYSRNPMYLGLLLFLLAWGLALGNAFNTLTAAGFVAYMNRFQIRPEERVLEARFGSEYRQYCKLVRRWF